MNRSRYLTRQLDKIDRVILAALTENGRMTVCDLAAQMNLSSPTVTDRINKMKDAGAIRGFKVMVDPKVFGLVVTAHVRMYAMPGQGEKVAQMLSETPEVVKADRVTGAGCFVATVVVCDTQKL